MFSAQRSFPSAFFVVVRCRGWGLTLQPRLASNSDISALASWARTTKPSLWTGDVKVETYRGGMLGGEDLKTGRLGQWSFPVGGGVGCHLLGKAVSILRVTQETQWTTPEFSGAP